MEQFRVLLAGDHKAALDMVSRMLSPEFDVMGAVGDGQTPLDEIERLQPDLLVADISMCVR